MLGTFSLNKSDENVTTGETKSFTAAALDTWLTFLSRLSEGDHLIELPFYQSISLSLVQPFATWKRLLYPREGTVEHNLQGLQVTLRLTMNERQLNAHFGRLRTLSQYQPALTPSLSCPMVTLPRGLRSAATSTLKMSVRLRSNFPPTKNI